MWQRRFESKRISFSIATAIPCAIALVGVGSASAAEAPSGTDPTGAPAARITAVAGEATATGGSLEQRAAVGEDQPIDTGENARLSLLLEEDVLCELCGSTSFTLTRREGKGPRVLRIDAGEARIVVEPRTGDERIEIHTPAAIATILGTVVYVRVDPQTGETTITSVDHPVMVTSSDANVKGATTLSGGESTTIVPGQAPQPKRRLADRTLANLGDCLGDLHRVSIMADRVANEKNVADRVASLDTDEFELPPVGPPGGSLALGGVLEEAGGGDDLTGQGDVIDPTDVLDGEEPGPVAPSACGFLPGEHCFF